MYVYYKHPNVIYYISVTTLKQKHSLQRYIYLYLQFESV